MEGRALHRPGSAQTLSADIGTVPEYWIEQNGPKGAEGQYLLPSEEFYVFFCSDLIFLLLCHGNKQASNKWRRINRDSLLLLQSVRSNRQILL
jgi:hypothetical protein